VPKLNRSMPLAAFYTRHLNSIAAYPGNPSAFL
jgi:hypothetical protein